MMMNRKSEPTFRQVRGIGLAAAVVLVAGLLGGCAGAQYQEPTHRWVSTENSTSAQYRVDHSYCSREVAGDSSRREFEVNSPGYDKYTACMEARGYTLTAYADSPAR